MHFNLYCCIGKTVTYNIYVFLFLGLILSSQMTGYMLIKFLGGTLVDKIDPTIIINGSLIFAGLLGAAFTGFYECFCFVLVFAS